MEIDVSPPLETKSGFRGRHCQVTHLAVPVSAEEERAFTNPLLPDFKNRTLNMLEVILKDVRKLDYVEFIATVCYLPPFLYEQEMLGFTNFAVCFPSSCSEEDLDIVFARDSFKDMMLGFLVDDETFYHFYINNNCQSRADENEITAGDKAFM